MSESPVPLLFVHHGDQWIRGSERCLIDQVANLDRQRFTPVLWTNCAPLADTLHALGVEVYRDRFTVLFDNKAPRYDFGNYWRLRRRGRDILRTHRIRLIHVNSSEPCQFVTAIARRERVPVILQLHLEHSMRSRCVRQVHQVSHMAAVSAATLKPMVDDGFPTADTSVIYNCIDGERLNAQPVQSRTDLGLEAKDYVVLAVGSLIHRKGFDLLVDAFAQLRSPGRRPMLVIAGGGPEAEKLERRAQELGIGDRLRMLGETRTAGAVMRDIGDVFVLPSRAEAFPLVTLEAGFFGLPCVAADVGGVAELIHDGVTGLLVPAENSEALRAALQRLIDDPGLALRCGAALRQRITREMILPASTRAFEALYSRYLSAQHAAQARRGWRWFPVYSRWLRHISGAVGKRFGLGRDSRDGPRRPASAAG